MKKIFFSLMLSALISSVSYGQYVEMTWDEHGLAFEVPKDFEIEVNNYEEFSASNDELYLSIFPFQDENINLEDLAGAMIQIAADLEYDVLSDMGIMELQNLDGYYVEGEKDGVQALIMTLLDEESSTNLIVVIVYTEYSFDEAVDVASSFYAY